MNSVSQDGGTSCVCKFTQVFILQLTKLDFLPKYGCRHFFLLRLNTDWCLYFKKSPLTVLEDVRLAVSTLHGALGQPDGPLLRRLAFTGLLLLVFLLLHADNHILGVQIGVR